MRTETLVGAFASEIGMIVISMATAGMSSGVDYGAPRALAMALSSIAGEFAPYLFAVGLVAAAFMALVVISLASSWAVVEAMGWQKDSFVWVYVLEPIPAVVIPILYPDLLGLALSLMVVFALVLIGPGVLLGRLASDRRVMGSYASSPPWRVAYWLSLAAILVLGVTALVT